MERKTAYKIAAHLANGDNEKFLRMVKVCIISEEIIKEKDVTNYSSLRHFEGQLLKAENKLKTIEDLRRRKEIEEKLVK